MKFGVFILFLLIGSVLLAQHDSSRIHGGNVAQMDSVKIDTVNSGAFVDRNGNGIDDRLEKGSKSKRKYRRMDMFKDEDGDGICDGKESSVGIKKMRRQRMKRGK